MFRPVLVILLMTTLSSCVFYVKPEPNRSVRVRPAPTVSDPEIIITDAGQITAFAPARGAGTAYSLNESISFHLQTDQSGYVTLTAYGPDGVASVFAQDVYVPGGEISLPTPESGVSYQLAPPRGLQRVTATFSSTPNGPVQDTAETIFYIQ